MRLLSAADGSGQTARAVASGGVVWYASACTCVCCVWVTISRTRNAITANGG